MRAPLTCLLAAVLVAGCGNGQKNSDTHPAGTAVPNTAAPNPAEQNPGAQNPGAQNPGAQNPGAQNPGAQNPGAPHPMGQPNAGQPNAAMMPPTPPKPGTGGPFKEGTRVWFNFVLKADGKVFQDSHGSQQTPTYVQGDPRVFPALQKAMLGMKPGEKKSVVLKPEEGFGPRDTTAVQTVPRSQIPGADSLHVGQVIGGMDNGKRFSATVLAISKDTVKLDRNNPLAGKTVTFEIEIVSVQ